MNDSYPLLYFEAMLRLNSYYGRTYFNESQDHTLQSTHNKENTKRSPQWNQIQSIYSSKSNGAVRTPKNYMPEEQRYNNQCQRAPRLHQKVDETTYSPIFRRDIPLSDDIKFQKSWQEPTSDHSAKYPHKNSLGDNSKQDYVARHQKRNQRIRSHLYQDFGTDKQEYSNQDRRYDVNSAQTNSVKQNCYSATKLRKQQRFGSRITHNNHQVDYVKPKVDSNFQSYVNSHPSEAQSLLARKPPNLSYLPYNTNSIGAIKPQMSFTPEKKQMQNIPGSAQRKQSLIEKSQQLQLKLRKMSSLQTSANQQKSSVQPEHSYNVRKSVSRGRFDGLSEPNEPQRIDLRNSNKETERKQAVTQKTYYGERRHIRQDNSGIRPRINEERTASSEENVIDKISKLNEKISQRIQSIIANYANK